MKIYMNMVNLHIEYFKQTTQIPSNVNGVVLPIFLPQFCLYIFIPHASLTSSAEVLLKVIISIIYLVTAYINA